MSASILATRAWSSIAVRDAFRVYACDRNPLSEHRLRGAIFSAGVRNQQDMTRVIDFMRKSPKFYEELGLPVPTKGEQA